MRISYTSPCNGNASVLRCRRFASCFVSGGLKSPKDEPNERSESPAAKLRDDALRQALQTPPTQHNLKPKPNRAKQKTGD